MQSGFLGTTVMYRDLHQNGVRARFGVLDKDVKVTIVVEEARVDQLELRNQLAPVRILLEQPTVGKCALRILVEHFHVGMRRRGIKVVVQFLDILTMIAFTVGKTKESFFQNRVACVPHGQGQAEALLVIAKASYSVFSPAIGLTPGRVVGQVVPGVAVRTVIFAYSAPLALAEIRPPFTPGLFAKPVFLKTLFFGVHFVFLLRRDFAGSPVAMSRQRKGRPPRPTEVITRHAVAARWKPKTRAFVQRLAQRAA